MEYKKHKELKRECEQNCQKNLPGEEKEKKR